MKQLLLKFQFVIGVFLLFSMGVQASDDDLITKQITVTLDEAGTLPDKIGYAKKFKITNLKIVGDINGIDVKFIREMAGSDKFGNSTNGKLSILDLSDAKIKAGGDYYYDDYYGRKATTQDNCMGFYFFYGCSSLTSVIIPYSVTGIYEAFYVAAA